MTKKQREALRRFRRVQDFLTKNQVEGTATKLQVLSEVVAGMSTQGEEKDATTRLTRGETARQRALRDALWNEHMVPLSRIARHAFGVPGMDVKFWLPLRRADNEAILDSARGMVQAAEQHVSVFVQQEGLPADFLDRFKAAIAELDAARSTKVETQRRGKTSRKTLDELSRRGIAAVDVLDAIVKPRLASKPELLGAWNSVKRAIDLGGGAGAVVAEPPTTPVVKVA
ncbi:MAG TPA: hypothetical protein VKH19_16655 [Gemmatimonadaceae bacterium]|nr:hypothetical protein [Gemmatimonadaceae bacterium]